VNWRSNTYASPVGEGTILPLGLLYAVVVVEVDVVVVVVVVEVVVGCAAVKATQSQSLPL